MKDPNQVHRHGDAVDTLVVGNGQVTCKSSRPKRPHRRLVSGASLDTLVGKLRGQLEVAAEALVDCPLVALTIVAHPDDEAIGPGGTLATLSELPGVALFVVVLAAEDLKRRSESQRAAEHLGMPQERVFLFDFPDGQLRGEEDGIRRVLRAFADVLRPDLVITHKADDHPDHTTLCELSRQVFGRNGVSLLHFRIPQPTFSPWQPVVWVRITPDVAHFKLEKLFDAYPTENWKDYFDRRKNEGLMVEAGHMAGSAYAEPFETSGVTLAPCSCGCSAVVLKRNPERRARPGKLEPKRSGAIALPIGRIVLEPSPCGKGLALARNAFRSGTLIRNPAEGYKTKGVPGTGIGGGSRPLHDKNRSGRGWRG